jgi:ABC-2 type transport system permease protein
MMAATNREPIDKQQLKTLLRVGLRNDLRSMTTRFGGARRSPFRIPPVAVMLVFALVFSIFLGAVVDKANDLFLGIFFMLGMQMMIIAITILLEFSNLILSPEDFPILAPHPVNSRTFFTAKVLHMVIYVTLLVVVLGLFPSVMAAIAYKNILLFPLTFAAVWGSGMASALFFAVFYTLMLRVANRERMHRYLSYLQLVLLFVLYGGYQFLPTVGQQILDWTKSSVDRVYLYLTPPGWFASWPSFLAGNVSAAQVWAASAGFVCLVVLYFTAITKLSFGYAKTLNETVEQQQEKTEVRARPGILSRLMNLVSSSEDRVVWQLMRKQFKYDNRYKLSLLMIFPLTLLYIYMGLKDGKVLIDPFAVVVSLPRSDSSFIVYMALAFVPFMVVTNSSYSASWQAAWVYFASPADRTRLVIATNRFAIIFFCIPYLLFLGGLMAYFFGNILHAVLHCIVLFLLLLALVGMISLLTPRLPFSMQQKSGQRMGSMMLAMFIPMMAVMAAMTVLSYTGYGGVMGYSTTVVALVLLSLLMSYLQKRIIPRRLAKLEFIEA